MFLEVQLRDKLMNCRNDHFFNSSLNHTSQNTSFPHYLSHGIDEKMETMQRQNFGGTNKEYYGIFESGLLTIYTYAERKTLL